MKNENKKPPKRDYQKQWAWEKEKYHRFSIDLDRDVDTMLTRILEREGLNITQWIREKVKEDAVRLFNEELLMPNVRDTKTHITDEKELQEIKARIEATLPTLKGKEKGEFLAKEALAIGFGGINLVRDYSGISRQTIAKYVKDYEESSEK